MLKILKINIFIPFIFLLCTAHVCNAQNWEETAILQASDYAPNDQFGAAVAIDGDYAIAGAPRNGTAQYQNAGAAYIYEKDENGNWLETQKLTAEYRTAHDYFGNAVAMSGNQAIVAAYYDDEAANESDPMPAAGAVYIFERNYVGYWEQVQVLTPNDRDTLDWFGYQLEVDSNQMAISAIGQDTDAQSQNHLEGAGAVYIFERDEFGVWTEKEKVTAPTRILHGKFGDKISFREDSLLVAHYENLIGADDTLIHFLIKQNNGWQAQLKLNKTRIIEPWNFIRDWNLKDFCFNENYIFIGNELASEIKDIQVFESINGIWTQMVKITPNDSITSLNFGNTLTLNNKRLFVGAKFSQDQHIAGASSNGASNGAVYIFDLNDNFNQLQKIQASDKQFYDNWLDFRFEKELFGNSIAVDRNNLIIGSPGKEITSTDPEGQAYIFQLDTIVNTNEFSNLIDVKVFPNPTMSSFTLEENNLNINSYEIYNEKAKLLKIGKIKSDILINVEFLPAGKYNIVFKNKKGQIISTKTLIKL